MINRINSYNDSLVSEELSSGTIKSYISEAKRLESHFNANSLKLDQKNMTDEDKKKTKVAIINYVSEIKDEYKNTTVTNKIIKINKYLKFIGLESMTVKNIKVQNKTIKESMTKTDFERVMRQAKEKGTSRDVLMLDVFYYTGIRVSELKYFTVESLKNGYMDVYNKGKYRQVPLVKNLIQEARSYIKKQDIHGGSILISREGNPLHRSTVFKRIKFLGGQARIKKTKAYPHSIRHLFAKNWLAHNNNNVLQLADLLGHESLDTTRRYTTLSIDEARKTINF